jgi:hypothetical protein
VDQLDSRREKANNETHLRSVNGDSLLNLDSGSTLPTVMATQRREKSGGDEFKEDKAHPRLDSPIQLASPHYSHHSTAEEIKGNQVDSTKTRDSSPADKLIHMGKSGSAVPSPRSNGKNAPLPHWQQNSPFPFSSSHPPSQNSKPGIQPTTPSLNDFPSPPHDAQPSKESFCVHRGRNCHNPSCKKERHRLQSRVQMLERQNKLLEAALNAVLYTAGFLNGCPCSKQNGRDRDGIHVPGIVGSQEDSNGMASLTGFVDSRRPSSTSVGSARSNSSALDLYKETRI